MYLAGLEIGEQDWALATEHLRVLDDRWDELDDIQRIDVLNLRARMAATRQEWAAEREALDAAAALGIKVVVAKKFKLQLNQSFGDPPD